MLNFVAARYDVALEEGEAHELFNANRGSGEATKSALEDATNRLYSSAVTFCGMVYARHGDGDGDERKQDALPGIPFASIAPSAISLRALT